MPRPGDLRTEAALWKHIAPHLLGRRKTRLESRSKTSGPGDAFIFFNGETVWIELKIGKPSARRLRPSQSDFIDDAEKSGVPVWCCFAHSGGVKWFFYKNDSAITMTPPFYRPQASRAGCRALRS